MSRCEAGPVSSMLDKSEAQNVKHASQIAAMETSGAPDKSVGEKVTTRAAHCHPMTVTGGADVQHAAQIEGEEMSRMRDKSPSAHVTHASQIGPWSDDQVHRLWALQREARRHGFRLYVRTRPGQMGQIMFGNGELTDEPYADLDAVAIALAKAAG